MNNSPFQILSIENKQEDRLILNELLSNNSSINAIDYCSSLNESIELLKEKPYDLILLDISIPDAPGIEGVIQLKRRMHTPTPIIVLTELNQYPVAMDALKHGAQDFIIKGDYNKVLVNRAIRYSIERHKGQLEMIKKNREILMSRDRLTKAEEMADLGSWEIDFRNNTVSLSEGMRQLLGIDPRTEKISFEAFSNYVVEEDKLKCLQALKKAKHSYLPVTIESRFKRENGTEFDSICKAENAESINNNRPVIYGVTVDISNLKEAQRVKQEFTDQLAEKVATRTQELENTQAKLQVSLQKEKELGELKSRFVSTASHQFRTPLTVIQSNIGLLEMQSEKLGIAEDPIFDKIISRVKREIVRMTDIMDEVLILSKINSGKISPIFRRGNILEMCASVVTKYNEIQLDGRAAMIHVIGSKKEVAMDSKLLEQAFSNIISNAFKYSKNRPAPEITLVFKEKSVEVKVQDFGMGIPEKDLKNLFTPFFRASNILDIPGTGLGTTIMKEYVELNNGEIKVESTVNKGTTVTIKLKTIKDSIVEEKSNLPENSSLELKG